MDTSIKSNINLITKNIGKIAILGLLLALLTIKSGFAKENLESDPKVHATYEDIFKALRPFDLFYFKKIRIGNKADGGYIVPRELLKDIDCCYTYSNGGNITFEAELNKLHPEIEIRLYDQTINIPKETEAPMYFKKEGIAARKNKNLNTYFNHLKENNHLSKRILLKIDTEGAEWDVLEHFDSKLFDNIELLVIEFHNLLESKYLNKYLKVFNKLNKNFTIFHIHANNCSKIVKIDGTYFPNVLEVTYVNNKHVKIPKYVEKEAYPKEMDNANCINSPTSANYPLNFWLKNNNF